MCAPDPRAAIRLSLLPSPTFSRAMLMAALPYEPFPFNFSERRLSPTQKVPVVGSSGSGAEVCEVRGVSCLEPCRRADTRPLLALQRQDLSRRSGRGEVERSRVPSSSKPLTECHLLCEATAHLLQQSLGSSPSQIALCWHLDFKASQNAFYVHSPALTKSPRDPVPRAQSLIQQPVGCSRKATA